MGPTDFLYSKYIKLKAISSSHDWNREILSETFRDQCYRSRDYPSFQKMYMLVQKVMQVGGRLTFCKI